MTDIEQEAEPSAETLRTQLRIEWDDHIQTRNQTWNMFQYQLVFLGVAIGADIQLTKDVEKPEGIVFIIFLGILMLIICYLGLRVSYHHRKVQWRIAKNKEVLGFTLKLDDKQIPGFNPLTVGKKRNLKSIIFKPTWLPDFLIQVQFLLLILVILYIIVRFVQIILKQPPIVNQ